MGWKKEIKDAESISEISDCFGIYPGTYTYGDNWFNSIWDNSAGFNNFASFVSMPSAQKAIIAKNQLQPWASGRKTLAKIPLVDYDDVIALWVEFYIYRSSGASYAYIGAIISPNYDMTGAVYDAHTEGTEAGSWTYDGQNAIINIGTVTGPQMPFYGLGVTCQFGDQNFDISKPNASNFCVDVVYLAREYNLKGWNEIEISEEFGDASAEGGYTGGTFDDSSDLIDLPQAPQIGVSSAGFVNIYNPSSGDLQQFGSELFPDLSFTPVSQGGTPSSVTDALVAMAEVLVDFGNQIPQIIDMYINSNLINYVIDCHIIPVAPQVSGSAAIKVGFKTFSQICNIVSSDYVDFDCGDVNIGEYYANFIDYAPYTQAKLFLPFIGFVDIAAEYWQSGTLNVLYRFNIIDGSFMCFVRSKSSKSKLNGSVIAQYGGNACVHIPITGLNYSSMVSGVVGAAQAITSAQPGTGGDVAVNSAIQVANSKPPLQQSNGYNATTSFLSVRVPYLLIERSVSNFSRNFASEEGIPSNITAAFSSLVGFTKATNVHLDGIAGATEEDLNEISALLAEGVIL